jgi:hypothetical protein
MVVWAFLQVVTLRLTRTGLSLEQVKIQKCHALVHGYVLGSVVTILPLGLILKLWLHVWYVPSRHLIVDLIFAVGLLLLHLLEIYVKGRMFLELLV